MEKFTILMTGAGAPGMPGILKCLKRANDTRIHLIGGDMNPLASCKHQFSKFYTIPSAKDDNYCHVLLEICLKEKVDLILSCVTKELNVLAQNKDLFNKHKILVAVLDFETLKIVNNKGNLLSELNLRGFDTPEFFIADSLDDVERYAKQLGYPQKNFCIKGVEGNGSRAVRTILSYDELAKDFFENKPNGMNCSFDELKSILSSRTWPCKLIVMEYLPGAEYAVDILAKNGNTIVSVVRRALSVFSSNQTQCVVEKNDYISDYCSKIVKEFNLSGNIGFDLKENSAGIPKIMEINPRLTGGIVACCAAGVNLPYLAILSWLDIPFDTPQVSFGVRMLRRFEELFFDSNDEIIDF